MCESTQLCSVFPWHAGIRPSMSKGQSSEQLLPSLLKSPNGCSTSNCPRRPGSARPREKTQNVPRKSDRSVCRNAARFPLQRGRSDSLEPSDSSPCFLLLLSFRFTFDIGAKNTIQHSRRLINPTESEAPELLTSVTRESTGSLNVVEQLRSSSVRQKPSAAF